jgi:hypothetical protein
MLHRLGGEFLFICSGRQIEWGYTRAIRVLRGILAEVCSRNIAIEWTDLPVDTFDFTVHTRGKQILPLLAIKPRSHIDLHIGNLFIGVDGVMKIEKLIYVLGIGNFRTVRAFRSEIAIGLVEIIGQMNLIDQLGFVWIRRAGLGGDGGMAGDIRSSPTIGWQSVRARRIQQGNILLTASYTYLKRA